MRLYLVAQAWFELLLKDILGKDMRLYLAGVESTGSLRSVMKMYMAASNGLWDAYFDADKFVNTYILQSFFYADEFTEKIIIPNAKDFLLDSGAFSFMEGAKAVDWDDYVERYADFINRNKIDKFFELDIDSVAGYETVLRLRAKLESLTGKRSIPVWHISRGKKEFEKIADEYDYIALGGIVSGEWKTEKYFPWFISEAHRRGARIHGLGYTRIAKLKEYHFDSVDSTAWTTGNRFGYIYHFAGDTMKKTDPPKGHRLADPKRVAFHNFNEWKKFQEYADKHL